MSHKNRMLHFLVLTNFILLLVISYLFLEDKEVLKLLSLAVAFFFIEYVVVSGLSFLVDSFQFISVMSTCTAITLVYLIFHTFLLWKKHIQIKGNLRCEFLLLIILIVSLPFIYGQSELYHLAQDQGVYQATAITMINGDTSVQYDFSEYNLIESDEDKATYREMAQITLLGYYPMNTAYPTVEDEDVLSDVSGIFHGIQTFPAILALWGSLFGIAAMMRIHTIFYFAAIVLTYYAIKSFTKSKWIQITATSIFAFSPLIMWLAKTSYTEMFLTLLIACYVFLLTEENNRKWMLGLPLMAFGFFHVSYLVILPIFILNHLILFLKEKDKGYLQANYLAALALSVGYYVMSIISPQYFFDNCSRLYIGSIITRDNFMLWMYFASIFIVVVSILVKRYASVCEKVLDYKKLSYCIPILAIVFLGFIIAYALHYSFFLTPQDATHMEVVQQYYGLGKEGIEYSSLYAFAILTGFFVVPCIICMLIFGFKKLYAHKHYLIYALMFGYLILFQCAFIRKEVFYYYYYARYLGFYIPIICICWVILLEVYKNKLLKFVVPVMCILVCLRYDVNLSMEQDDTVVEWATLIDIADMIEENSAIVSNVALIREMGVPLRAMADVALFPMFDDLDSQMQMLQTEFDHVYVLANDGGEWDEIVFELEENNLTLRYQNMKTYSCYERSYTGNAIPTGVTKIDELYILYEYASIELVNELTIGCGYGENIEKMNYYNWNNFDDKYSWTTDQSGIYFEAYNIEDDVEFEMESFSYGYSGDTMVYLNGYLVQTLENHELRTDTFVIPSEYLDESGMQYLEFVTPDATTPEAIYGPGDTRTLGLCISYITLRQD
ncbi:MAG: hypothetical protein R3Y47_10475 [Lachnospiraceae bacterium]